MSKILLSAIAIATVGFASGSAFADPIQNATGTLSLSATAQRNCSGLSLAPTGLDLSGAINPITNQQRAFGPSTIQGGTVTCNFPGAKLGLKSRNGGLTLGNALNSNTDPVAHIPYTVTPSWGTGVSGGALSPLSAGDFSNTSATASAPYQDLLTLSILVADNGSNVLPFGDYSDTLSVNVGAGFN
jgi:hypothetical protein